jgi:hypothetical protein
VDEYIWLARTIVSIVAGLGPAFKHPTQLLEDAKGDADD